MFVCGITVEINPNYLSRFLEIDISLDALYPIPEPDSDDMNDEDNTDWDVVATILCGRRREWLGGVLKQKFLTPSNHILNIFAYFNVEPKGRTSKITMETGYLLYMIRTGQPIDLPLAIFKHMLNALQGAKTTSLPYDILVTRILFSHGVGIGPHDDIVRRRGKLPIGLLVCLPHMSSLMIAKLRKKNKLLLKKRLMIMLLHHSMTNKCKVTSRILKTVYLINLLKLKCWKKE